MKKGRFYRPFFVISFLALNALPEILSKGTMVFANDERHPGKLGFMFAAPVEIMGKKTYLGAVVHQMIADGQNKFYLLDMVDERGWRFGIEKDADSSMGRVPQGVVTGESVASFNTKVTQRPDVVKPSKSQLNVDTDNPIYRSGVEEADYGEADTDPIDESVSINRYDVTEIKGNQATANGLPAKGARVGGPKSAPQSSVSKASIPKSSSEVNGKQKHSSYGVEEDTNPIDESVSINRYDVTEIKGNQAKTNGLPQRRFQDENENTPASASLISNGNVPQNTVNVNTENASSIGVDTANPIYRSGVEEADYGEALPDGYSEYEIVQEMLSDARGTMNDFKGNTKLKAELDEEVRKQIGERRTGTGEREQPFRDGYRRRHGKPSKAGEFRGHETGRPGSAAGAGHRLTGNAEPPGISSRISGAGRSRTPSICHRTGLTWTRRAGMMT
ncbi:MAG: hypothetical protein MJ074_01800 [Oscillospiraceae bacterium]|nr:hypothetical protein [Oscillospiraceae bacterium]